MSFLTQLNGMVVSRLLKYLPDRQQIEGLQQIGLRDQVGQRLLFEFLRQRAATGQPMPLRDAAFSVFSQSDEDGVLLAIFAAIGFGNRQLVDLGCGVPVGSNSANLVCNWGFWGLLIDGDSSLVTQTTAFYSQHRDTHLHPPRSRQAWVSCENVNALITDAGVGAEIDLLSIDLDGVDWWIWKAIDVIRPRVLAVEVQDIWGPDEAVTVPYRSDFEREDGYNYCGASLAAWVKLCRERGYRLVGGNRYGQNAFFVRNGLGDSALPEVSPGSCLTHPMCVEGQRTRLPQVRDRIWERV